MNTIFSTIFLITSLWNLIALGQNCDPVDFENGSTACKCNATYCDFYPDPEPLSTGKYISYTTSKAEKRLERKDGDILSTARDDYITIIINSTNKYQKIEGFGGAFTDSAGINIKNLSSSAQDNLLRSYFSSNGSKYSLGRVPIGGTDFSTRFYTYDETDEDTTLTNFRLATEDAKYKIPLMQEALKLNPELRFVSAAWTAPTWMRYVNSSDGFSYLKEDYYQTYADYIVKFLEEYQRNGLEIWATSTGNEPLINEYKKIPVVPNSMYWSPDDLAKWILNNLGPSIQNSSSSATSILAFDDQRTYLLSYMTQMHNASSKALDYVKGIAIHWYFDDDAPATVLDEIHNDFSDQFILMTESSLSSDAQSNKTVSLGSWLRAEALIEKLFENLNHWVAGWIDWNLALNTEGGPNYLDIYSDPAIVIEAENDTFYKQPYYYAMTHFSKFVPRNSVRIQAESSHDNILMLAFETVDNQKVVLLYNKNDDAKNVSVVEGNGYINVELPAYSLHTILFKNE